MDDRQEDVGDAMARKRLRLLIARGDLSEARTVRLIQSVAESAVDLRQGAVDQDALDRHAYRLGAMLEAERLLQSELPEEVDLSAMLERYATLLLIGSGTLNELRTSFSPILVGGEVCRWIMLAATELIHAIEACATPQVGCTVILTVEHEEHGIVMSVVAQGGAGKPMPRRSGAEALTRVGRLMRLFGTLSTSIHDDDVIHQATFEGGRVRPPRNEADG